MRWPPFCTRPVSRLEKMLVTKPPNTSSASDPIATSAAGHQRAAAVAGDVAEGEAETSWHQHSVADGEDSSACCIRWSSWVLKMKLVWNCACIAASGR